VKNQREQVQFLGGKFNFIISFLLGAHGKKKKWLLLACVCDHAVAKNKRLRRVTRLGVVKLGTIGHNSFVAAP